MADGNDLTRPWGERLRWWREHQNLSRAEFCQRLKSEANRETDSRYVNPDEKLLYTWESGKNKHGPQGVYCRALARMGAPLPSTALFTPDLPSKYPALTTSLVPTAGEDDDVDRRAFFRTAKVTAAAAAVGAGALTEPWQRLQSALAGHTKLDEHALEAIERDTRDLFDAEERMPAAQVVSNATAHLDRITALLGSTENETFKRRLTSHAGASAALAGWLAYDQGAFETAARYYDVAESAAIDANDAPLTACVGTYRSYLAAAHGSPLEASRFLREALNALPRGTQPAMLAWLSARQAEEHVALGALDDALRFFERAFVAQDFITNSNEQPLWTHFFTPTRLDGMAVAGYARINHPNMDSVADRLLTNVGECRTKVEAIAVADLAYAYLERGDIERGAELGQRSLDAIARSNTRVGYERLSVINHALSPYRNARAASDLRDRLSDTLQASRHPN